MTAPGATTEHPRDALVAALSRWDAARKAKFAARVANDVNALTDAVLEEMDAEGEYNAARSDAAAAWLLGFRLALDLYPETVAAMLDELVKDIPPAVGVVDAITELEDRVDAAEDAVVALEQDRVYR